MSGTGIATPCAPHSWPLPDHANLKRHVFVSSDFSRSQRLINSPQKAGEAESNLLGPAAKSHIPLRSEPHRHRTLPPSSSFSATLEPSCVRKAAPLGLEPRPAVSKRVRFNDLVLERSVSTAQLRGGADRHPANKLRWLKRAHSLDQKLGKASEELAPSAVTFKGKEIGRPQLVPALHALPSDSRAVSLVRDAHFDAAVGSLLDNAYGLHGYQQHSTVCHNGIARVPSPLPPSPALRATPSRPATTNSLAGIDGNPDVLRAGPVSRPVGYTLEGSLVGKPSALDVSKTAYGPLSALQESAMLHGNNSAPSANTQPHQPEFKVETHKAWADRKWYALPSLPPEGALETSGNHDTMRKQGDDEQPFDTEEVLKSLRPERLGLYNISPSGCQRNDFANADNSSAAIIAWPVQTIASNTGRQVYESGNANPTDSDSVRTRDWDLQSCDTDDLGIDTRLEKQRELARRVQKHRFPSEQPRQRTIRGNNETLSGLPEAEPASPESIFYTELISIVSDYYEFLQRVVQGAYDAGEMSEGHFLREKWRHRTAMERRLQAAEDMSGYRILTAVKDIKEAVKHPTGYAIYSSLLKIRDPETWQRVFETVSLQQSPTPVADEKPPKHAAESSLKYLARKAGRAVRFMLAVPSNPELKTYSNRHPRPAGTITYHSPVSIPGPNIPGPNILSRSHTVSRPTIFNPLPPHQPPSLRSEEPRPSTQTERPSKVSNDTTRINGNTLCTGTTLVSPLNGRYVRAPRSRGFEQGVFVTVVSPSVVSNASEKTAVGYGAGKLGIERRKGKERESGVTAWPEVEW